MATENKNKDIKKTAVAPSTPVKEENKGNAPKVSNVQKKYIDFTHEKLPNQKIVISIEDAGKTVESIQRQEKVGRIVSTTLLYVVIVFLALVTVFPFYWMLITSLKMNDEIIASTQTFFPNIVMWTNYVYVFQTFKFGTFLMNTVVVAFFSTAGTLITSIFAAFAFSRLEFKGRDAIFWVFLMTMMIPGEMMVISNYITVASFGWIENQTRLDAYLSMIVPFMVSVLYVYLLRQNFKQIPNELYLAAKVDGKSDWSFLWKVMVPLAAPTLLSIAILKFMGTWNSYVWPALVTQDDAYKLISNGLRGSAFQDPELGRTEFGYQMAGTVLVTVPLFLLFIIFRKYIMHGVGRAGIKG
ncbi:MAG: carbohydrate ABC transporter permease [Bacilli bacterium]|nr:carbohydrate ABC transporter permease [Bacilli bacterium]